MKDSLRKHIANIFSCICMEEKIPFEVFDCRVDALPDWTNQVQITHEFLVCCEQNSHKDNLQRFLSKEVYQRNNHLYWFEGDRIIDLDQIQTSSEQVENTTKTDVNYQKSNTRLPTWIDDFIFNRLGAEYAPDFQRFEYNLNLTKEENLKYLGTYFPRSYAESFCIFDNIFQNKQYQDILLQKDAINILSVGCGTGGDLIGLLTIIEKYCSSVNSINIWAVDGNNDAITILEEIVDRFQTNTLKRINLKTHLSVFASLADVDLSHLAIDFIEFDFILSFKMICEIIAMGKGIYDNSYYEFIKKFAPLMSNDGLCILLDVTTKAEHTKFYNPILMNRQVNQALREQKIYKTLLPLSCNLHENECNEDCFIQQHFFVTHSKQTNDLSKVAYRVIAPRLLCNRVVNPIEDVRYKIQTNKDGLCFHTWKNKTIADSYKLNP